jgi:hypothetical protein
MCARSSSLGWTSALAIRRMADRNVYFGLRSPRSVNLPPRVSRPAELHHRPLAEPSVRLSPHSLSFHSNAHHHGSLPQQLGVVWDLLLKADPERPSLISHAAVRHRFHFALIRYMCLCSTLGSKN